MRKIIPVILFLWFMCDDYAQIHVSSNNLFLQDKNGKPFFWLADVRTGKSISIHIKNNSSAEIFNPPAVNKDWVLVIDDASKKFKAPGVLLKT